MTRSLPRPSVPLTLLSILTIAGCLVLLSAFIGLNIAEPNPFALVGGVIFVPLCLLLPIHQYRGTFHCNASAARTVSVFLYFVCGFWLFAFATTLGEAVIEGLSLRLMAPFLLSFLILALYGFFAARLNARWSRALRAAIAAGVSEPRRGFTLKELLLLVAVVAAMSGIARSLSGPGLPDEGEHVDASAGPRGVPAGAQDISYARGYRGTIAYEFTCDEATFCEWASSGLGSIESESAEIPVREIESPFTIRRYYGYSSTLQGPDRITITNGQYYTWSKEDRGVHAAFDRDTGRAYYHAHFH